jgi:uncharacterized membrane protein YbhN (UPF0104 family)
VFYGFCLQACLAAFGATLSFWSLLPANIFLGTLASLVPIPGGSTAVASVGLSGALVAFGVPKEIAVAAVLTNQLVVSYLPAVPGWVARPAWCAAASSRAHRPGATGLRAARLAGFGA